jgi:hypothetical protein
MKKAQSNNLIIMFVSIVVIALLFIWIFGYQQGSLAKFFGLFKPSNTIVETFLDTETYISNVLNVMLESVKSVYYIQNYNVKEVIEIETKPFTVHLTKNTELKKHKVLTNIDTKNENKVLIIIFLKNISKQKTYRANIVIEFNKAYKMPLSDYKTLLYGNIIAKIIKYLLSVEYVASNEYVIDNETVDITDILNSANIDSEKLKQLSTITTQPVTTETTITTLPVPNIIDETTTTEATTTTTVASGGTTTTTTASGGTTTTTAASGGTTTTIAASGGTTTTEATTTTTASSVGTTTTIAASGGTTTTEATTTTTASSVGTTTTTLPTSTMIDETTTTLPVPNIVDETTTTTTLPTSTMIDETTTTTLPTSTMIDETTTTLPVPNIVDETTTTIPDDPTTEAERQQEILDQLAQLYNNDSELSQEMMDAVKTLPPNRREAICRDYCNFITTTNTGFCETVECSNANEYSIQSQIINEELPNNEYAPASGLYSLLDSGDGTLEDYLQSGIYKHMFEDGNDQRIPHFVNHKPNRASSTNIIQKDTEGVSNIFAPNIYIIPKRNGGGYSSYIANDPNDPSYRDFINNLVSNY